VETVLRAGLWRVEADPTELEAAIVNLAVNARDAMSNGGRLTIETSNAHIDEAYVAAHSEVVAGQYVAIAGLLMRGNRSRISVRPSVASHLPFLLTACAISRWC
jgi:signal transduction histidine kinase